MQVVFRFSYVYVILETSPQPLLGTYLPTYLPNIGTYLPNMGT